MIKCCVKWKKEKKWKVKAQESDLRRGRDPYCERYKNLPWEDSEWMVYLSTDVYHSVKA